jgi:pimeloyl-ACP methyl ester carboxylesterase
MPKATANGIMLEYESIGSPTDPAIVLISGLGTQLLRWTMPFCERLAAEGSRVVRFDNRDIGLSTYFDDHPVPDIGAVARAVAQGQKPDAPYTLHDMAADTVGLMDALGIARAHIVGRSMGGMIGQLVASTYADRTLSLVSIMSSSGNPALPAPKPEAMAVLTRPGPDPAVDEDAFVAHALANARIIGSPGFPFDEAAHGAQVRQETRRAHHPAGAGRQLAAVTATGDRRAHLKTIAAPTLVIHGDADPLVPLAEGQDTAANIAGAELMVIEGMGHDLPAPLFERVALAVARNARRV